MQPFPSFDYEAPSRLADAISLLCLPGSRIISGGTDLLPSMKHGLFAPARLVSLRRIPELKEITRLQDGSLAIGASISLDTLARLPEVQRDYPGLVAACRTVATPTIQKMATLGGNVMLDTRCLFYNQPSGWRASVGGCLKKDGTVCHVAPKGKGCYAAHSADTVPTLWLLGAQVELVGPSGVRLVSVRSLYGEDGRSWHQVQPEEILTRVILPAPDATTVHRKLRTRAAIDYGLLLVAAKKEGGEYRAVISCTGPSPIEVRAENPVELAEAAFKAVQPLATHAPAVPWRKKLVRVEVRRAAEGL